MGLRVDDMGLRVDDMGLRVDDMGPGVDDMGLVVGDIGLGVGDIGLRVDDIGLRVDDIGLGGGEGDRRRVVSCVSKAGRNRREGSKDMPITGIGSWLTTIDEFVAHWTAVNAFLGLNPFKLTGGYTLANFQTERGTLAAALTDVQNKDNARQNAAGDRDVKRSAIRPRMLQFGPTVRGLLPGSRHIPGIPKTPSFNSSAGTWRDRMDDMANLWLAINTNTPPVTGFTPPLLLSGAYTQATFATERTALDAAFTALSAADLDATSARQIRNAAFDPVYERMKQYRLAVAAALPAGHPLAGSIPALSPPPGSTPDPVQLSASWNPVTTMADLVWSESQDVDLDYYSIRYHPGPRYKAAEEQTVASAPVGTLEFSTAFGLPAQGSVAWFKVYVVVTTGNEKGSNAVKVVRT